ncbi:hypothetical protein pb186bvf_003167 [Paramecium bursaria]
MIFIIKIHAKYFPAQFYIHILITIILQLIQQYHIFYIQRNIELQLEYVGQNYYFYIYLIHLITNFSELFYCDQHIINILSKLCILLQRKISNSFYDYINSRQIITIKPVVIQNYNCNFVKFLQLPAVQLA